MDSYFCIISTPGEAVADLCVLDAVTDDAALLRAGEVARQWNRIEKVEVFHGERRVGALDHVVLFGDLRQAA